MHALREKLNGGDWTFLAVCAVIFAVGLAVGIAYFDDAFPEASIDFQYDRAGSQKVAEQLLNRQKLAVQDYRHAALFEHDESAKIFLERELGLQKANELTRRDIKIWSWRHRWFRPLQIEEIRVDVAPTGEIVSFFHKVPEERPGAALSDLQERTLAESFLQSIGIAPTGLQLVSRSEQSLPKRKDVTYVWEARDLRPAGAPYRYTVTVHGDRVGAFSQALKVPDQWIREYQELRSKNFAAAAVDQVFLALTVIAALAIFIIRLLRKDIQLRFALGAGLIGGLLVILVSLNEFPSALAGYDTDTSYPAFLAQQILFPILQGLIAAIFLAVIVGAGESLYRQRLPRQLAMPRLFATNALSSKRVFKSLVLGYTLFAAFLAYQVIFYLVASRLGAWAPADIPYHSILNSAFPWAAVLFMGFFPAVSEEFMSRAFSIPFFERWVRSPLAAMIIAGFIWGFGHAAYPNQPFYIRGVEVGVAGVIMGLLMYRFGLLGLLIWHYTVDALYTSLLLFRSNNPYYIFSAGLASLIFVIPMGIAIILYLKRGGFEPDEPLENAAIGSVAAPVQPELEVAAPLTPAELAPVRRRALVLLGGSVVVALAAIFLSGPTLESVINYKISKQRAIDLARHHLTQLKAAEIPARVLPLAVAGFRSWDAESGREEGGAPGGFDQPALQYLFRHSPKPIDDILRIQRHEVEAATWMSRFFEPMKKEEIFVEVDPRNSQVIGYHRYREENAPGAALEQDDAEQIARGTFPRYGLNAQDFEVKEALTFQQPRRRDWLFHYQEKKPLLADSYRRASVRVMGNEVTQFAKTIRIPERDRREAEKETVLNTVLVVAKVLAVVSLLGLVIYGCVAAARQNRFAWRAATKWTLMLSPVAVVAVFLQRELFLAQYNTSVPWETFTIVMIVTFVFLIAMQLGLVWLSVAVAETCIPAGRRLLGREGASRYGTAAVVSAVTAVSLFASAGIVLRNLPHWLPRLNPIDALSIPETVAIPWPAVGLLWQAAVMALALSAAAAGLVAALEATPTNRQMVLKVVIAVSVMLLATDASIRLEQAPLMLVIAAGLTALLYLSAKYVLGNNYLAYPLTFFTFSLFSGAVFLLQNQRFDLRLNAAVLMAIAVGTLVWYGLGVRLQDERARV